MDCTCLDESQQTYIELCVICNDEGETPMTPSKRTKTCKLHRMIMVCGDYEYVCAKCKELGWYSTAGWGGGTYHKNRITGVTIDPRKSSSNESTKKMF